LVEQLIRNQQVIGSSPIVGSSLFAGSRHFSTKFLFPISSPLKNRHAKRCASGDEQMKTKVTVPDVLIRDAFTLILFCPLSARSKEWVDENVQSDAQWFGDALCVEPRHALGLAEGMRAGPILTSRRVATRYETRNSNRPADRLSM
jgi:hypothetical protein